MGVVVNFVCALLGFLSARIGDVARRGVGVGLGRFVARVLKVRVAEVMRSQARAGLAPGLVVESYERLGVSLVELLGVHGGRSPSSHVRFDATGRDLLTGSPVVIAATHTANWELVLAESARVAAPHGGLAAVVKPLSVRALDAFCRRFRERFGVSLLPPTGAIRASANALRAGRKVVMLVDQVPPRSSRPLWRTFLGGRAMLDRAPFVLAARANVPVAVVAAHREGATSIVHVLAWMVPPPRSDDPSDGTVGARAAWIDDAAAKASDVVDAFVRVHPADWLWLHRRWKSPPSVRPVGAPAVALAAPAQ